MIGFIFSVWGFFVCHFSCNGWDKKIFMLWFSVENNNNSQVYTYFQCIFTFLLTHVLFHVPAENIYIQIWFWFVFWSITASIHPIFPTWYLHTQAEDTIAYPGLWVPCMVLMRGFFNVVVTWKEISSHWVRWRKPCVCSKRVSCSVSVCVPGLRRRQINLNLLYPVLQSFMPLLPVWRGFSADHLPHVFSCCASSLHNVLHLGAEAPHGVAASLAILSLV